MKVLPYLQSPRSWGSFKWKLLNQIYSLPYPFDRYEQSSLLSPGPGTIAQTWVMWRQSQAVASGYVASVCEAWGGTVALGNPRGAPWGLCRGPEQLLPVPDPTSVSEWLTRTISAPRVGCPRDDKEFQCCTTNLQDLWAGEKNTRHKPIVRLSHLDSPVNEVLWIDVRRQDTLPWKFNTQNTHPVRMCTNL